MHRNSYRILITLTAIGLAMPVAASAANYNRKANTYEQVESKRSSIQRRTVPAKSSRLPSRSRTKPGTNQIKSHKRSTPSRSTSNRSPNRSTVVSKPRPTKSYKPAPTRDIRPQRNKQPVRSVVNNRPIRQSKPAVTKPSRAASAYTPPTNRYQPQGNAYRPQTNAYRPQGNPYKAPAAASSRLRTFPNNNSTNNNFGQIIRKPGISTGLRRDHDRTRGAGNDRNNRPLHHYRPWHLTHNNRYNPATYPSWWYSSNAGYGFAIEQSYGVWQNTFGQAYRPGYYANHLPSYYDRFSFRNNQYYAYGGLYFSYQNNHRRFALVSAPIGFRINTLPRYAVGFYLGNTLYFNSYNNYYRYLPNTSEYIVVEKPVYEEEVNYVEESYSEPEGGMYLAYNDGGPIYYPNAGQSEAQMSLDLDECHEWSVRETNFDPSIPYPTYDAYKADGFTLALESCMISRGYTVN